MSGYGNSPMMIDVKAGDRKAICACGLSKNLPLCDGSHAGSGKSPHIETFSEDKKVAVCTCFKSGKLPFCDGSHSR